MIDDKLVNFSNNYDTKISFLKDLSQQALDEASKKSIGKEVDMEMHHKALARFKENQTNDYVDLKKSPRTIIKRVNVDKYSK